MKWHPWWAWYPIKLRDREWVWLSWIARRLYEGNSYFGYEEYYEYEDIRYLRKEKMNKW